MSFKPKLTRQQALEIYHSPDKLRDIAERYGVSHVAVHYIKTGKTWSRATRGVPNEFKEGCRR